MKNRQLASYGSNALGAICTALQTNEILQIISLVLTIIATAFSISFTIFNWYKKAKEDGKITTEEISDLMNDLKKYKKEKWNEF